jgi:hypothetical protein
LGIDAALRLVAKQIVTVQGDLDEDDDEPDELPNTGCNYDPADPRGWYKDEETKIVRRRAWLNMAHSAKEYAESFTSEHGHRAIAVADSAEIDDEIVRAVAEAVASWMRVLSDLQRKQASTLPQDGRSKVPADDCTSEPSDDFPEIPSGLDRRLS